MNHKDFYCNFNMPVALSGDDEFRLPPYAPQNDFSVDDYDDVPDNWMRSDGKMSSYFVGVKSGHGMWLDFNQNHNHKKDVAILISVQGVNPITGLPQEKPILEQYNDVCPKHNCKFGKDRFCEECGYQWPKQNYLSTRATPNGRLWLDGFRTIDGLVRQYIFTEEMTRGVAANIIGDKRVYAIGITFFESKKDKPVHDFYGNNTYWTKLDQQDKSSKHIMFGNSKPSGNSYKEKFIDPMQKTFENMHLHKPRGITGQSKGIINEELNCKVSYPNLSIASNSVLRSLTHDCFDCSVQSFHSVVDEDSFVESSSVEIGAGAKIKQKVDDCPEDLDFWKSEPSGMICINYCSDALMKKILKGGKKDFNSNKEGFLNEILVGN